MKVLISTDMYSKNVNGVTTSVKILKNQLVKLGHEVKILTLSPVAHSMVVNEAYYLSSFNARIYPKVRFSLAYFDKRIKELIEWKPDIVHIQTEFSSSILVNKIIKKLKCPVVYTCHTIYEDYTKYISPSKKIGKIIAKKIVGRVLNISNVAIAPSKKLKTILLRYGAKIPIHIIPTGIDLNLFSNKLKEEKRAELNAQYNILPTDKVMVMVSRIAIEKNIEEIINLFSIIVQKDKNYKLLIVGDGPYKEKLEDQVRILNLHKSVIFTGMIPHKELYNYYQMGKVFLCASKSETQGLTYVEALANGLPLICKRDECAEDVIENDVNGYIYDTDEDFYKYVDIIMNDEILRKRMGEKSLEVSKRFSREEFGRRVNNLYKQLIEK